MRVAVHFPDDHPLAQDGAAVVAYRLGRVEDGVHNAPVGHDPVPLDEFLTRLVRDAREEFPDADVVIERLIDNGDGTSGWIPAEEFDPEEHTPVGAGVTVEREANAKSGSRGGSS
jgi:hypothetical protein